MRQLSGVMRAFDLLKKRVDLLRAPAHRFILHIGRVIGVQRLAPGVQSTSSAPFAFSTRASTNA
jgi:hypothetical protein